MGRTSSRAALAVLLLLAGCGGWGGEKVKGPAPSAPATMRLTSPEFADGATIPRSDTCAGRGAVPRLGWTRPPARTRALALTVEDPDAPGGTFLHWIAFDLGPTVRTVAGDPPRLPGRHAANSAGGTGWTPPCPPPGRPHRYVFTIYALRAPLDLRDHVDPAVARAAIARAAIARGKLTGRFGR
jgi:Raf kinase inhibitor-like YbhB/YbcL family protein